VQHSGLRWQSKALRRGLDGELEARGVRGYDSAGLALQIPRSHRAHVPVLDLRACWAQGKPDHDGAVPWPCSTEYLQQRI
jgi:hypothetical protein